MAYARILIPNRLSARPYRAMLPDSEDAPALPLYRAEKFGHFGTHVRDGPCAKPPHLAARTVTTAV